MLKNGLPVALKKEANLYPVEGLSHHQTLASKLQIKLKRSAIHDLDDDLILQ